ncbi:hypothetical protein GUJ93_ZPchr0002g25986 [Zizania palustris]|uniref:Uncharacterized protein n=1 Tax=Zizania palustris TaxID=103762 RepID=A0A8J5VWK4_ZIZPA|nr:hypothetical protein GUJ93_ZPchr0002g25986 [Zizania palustris]
MDPAAVVEDEEEAYWTEWEEAEEEARARESAPVMKMCPTGDEGPDGVHWVVMGRSSPQKHTHAARLAEVLVVPYISMGTLYKKVRACFAPNHTMMLYGLVRWKVEMIFVGFLQI